MKKFVLNLINVILNNILIIILSATVISTSFLFVAEIAHFEFESSSEATCDCGKDYSYFNFFVFYIPFIFYSIMFYLNYFLKNRYKVSIILYFLCSFIIYTLFFTIFYSLQKHELILTIPFFAHIILNLTVMNTSHFKGEVAMKKFLFLVYNNTKFALKLLVYFLSSFTIFSMIYNFIQKFCKHFINIKIINLNDIILQEKFYRESFLLYLTIYVVICNFIFSYFFQLKSKIKEILIFALVIILPFTIISYTNILYQLLHFYSNNELLFFIIIFFTIPSVFTLILRYIYIIYNKNRI